MDFRKTLIAPPGSHPSSAFDSRTSRFGAWLSPSR